MAFFYPLQDEKEHRGCFLQTLTRLRLRSIEKTCIELYSCYGLNCVLNSYIGTLTPKVTVFRDRAFKKVIKVKWGHRVGSQSDRTGVLTRTERERHRRCSHTEKRPGEDGEREQPYASQAKRPREKPNLLTS